MTSENIPSDMEKVVQYAQNQLDPIIQPLIEDILIDLPADLPSYILHWIQTHHQTVANLPPMNLPISPLAVTSPSRDPSPTQDHTNDSEMDYGQQLEEDDEDERPAVNPGRRRTAISAEPMDDSQLDQAMPYFAKSEEEQLRLEQYLSGLLCFGALEPGQLKELAGAMQAQEFEAGQVIIQQGDIAGDFFYVLDRGEADCFVRRENGQDEHVKTYVSGESFGELALMYNAARRATIRAKTACRLWALGRLTFRRMMMSTMGGQQRTYEELLRKVPLLESLNRSEIQRIADALVLRHFDDGEAAVRQGETGNEFFIIAEGGAVVCKQYEEHGAMIDIAELGVGDYFGEVALVTDNPRRASVLAKGLMTCLVLDREAFNRVLGPISEILKRTEGTYEDMERKVYQEKLDMIRGLHSPVASEDTDSEPVRRFSNRRRTAVSAEPVDMSAYIDQSLPVFEKTAEQKKRIRDAISNNFLFAALEPAQRTSVVDAMFEMAFEDGEKIIQQGDEGDNFYILDRGVADCFVEKEGENQLVRQFKAGEGFGDLALMYNCPRSATIVAKGSVAVWAVDRTTFRRMLMDTTSRKRRTWEDFIGNITVLKSLDRYERAKLVDSLTEQHFDDGEYVIRQGETGDAFYIVEEGSARVTQTFGEGSAEVQVHEYGVGDYFGELALLKDQPRAANVIAVGPLKTLRLDRSSFVRLMGPCEDILKRNASMYEEISEQMRDPPLEIMD